MLFVGAAIAMLYGLIELAAAYGFAPWFGILERVARGNPSFYTITRTKGSTKPRRSAAGQAIVPAR